MGSDIIVGLDVGTTKVCVVVAELNSKGVDVIGVGTSSSTGIRKGTIINIDATVDSIKKAVQEGESFSGTRIKSVSVGISGGHIKGFNSIGAVGIRGKEVSSADLERAIEAAKTVYIPLDREILHVIPTEFVLDGQDGIVNPVGMSGVRLEARAHIITGAVSSVQNLIKCCRRADLDITDIVLEPLAVAHSTLKEDEREFGVVLIDIGGGTTDIALFKDNCLRHISVLGIGGDHITSDIAIGMRVNMHEAERLKKGSGAAFENVITDNSEEIHITQSGGQKKVIPRKYLAEIIQPRCEEMLELIKHEIKACFGYELATCGIVFTGGTSLLKGFAKLAESHLCLPVRVGVPLNISGLKEILESPVYSTGIGLIKYVTHSDFDRMFSTEIFTGVFTKMKDWVKSVFT